MAIDPIIKEKADDIRNKIYGKEVRESLASGLEEMSADVVDTVSRQGNVESQFQDVIENTTDKDVISAPEIIAARNGEANLKTRLDEEHQEVTAQLAQTEKKLSDKFINVATVGAVGDYRLENGELNPNPTDNTQAIQQALDMSPNIRLAKGIYYCADQINVPQGATIDGNHCSIVFEENGFNLGDSLWNRPTIHDLVITNRDRKHTGKGIFTESGYIAYPHFYNLELYGFEYGFYFNIEDANSNCTWGKFEHIRIEYCDYGMKFSGGWMNTVHFDSIWLNYNDINAILFESVKQMHGVYFDMLTLETNSTVETNPSPVHFLNCGSSEISIDSVYAENNGYRLSATAQDKLNYMTNGTKITNESGHDTKSYLLNDKVYSEDTNRISNYDINGQGLFRFTNSPLPTKVRLKNSSIFNEVLNIMSFDNAPIEVFINDIFHYCLGYSYPNMRTVFYNSTPAKNVRIKTKNLANEGGGSRFDYNEGNGISISGERFGGITEQGYASYSTSARITLPALSTVSLKYLRNSNNIGITFDPTDDTKYVIRYSGLYVFTTSFVFVQDNTEGVNLIIRNTFNNRIGSHIPDIKGGTLNSFTGAMYLQKGDTVQLTMENLSDKNVELLGTSANTNFLNIVKMY